MFFFTRKVKQAFTCLPKVLYVLLTMSGILLDRVSGWRLLTWVLILSNVVFFYYYGPALGLPFTIAFVVGMFVLRYLILFLSFTRRGIAPWLIRRYGEAEGYERYEALTAVLFFYRGSSFNLLLLHTSSYLGSYQLLFNGLGWVLIAVATLVNVWATLIVGKDVYYYKDMFVGRSLGEFKLEGPFRYFSNPMYGIGQGAAYGAALLCGSGWGVLATLLNQITMYIFYFAFEKPHIERIFRAAPPTGDLTYAPAPVMEQRK